jgi:hypothetical protein
MSQNQSVDKSQLLADLPSYIYGTTRLGEDKIPFDDRVRLARAAMDGVSWFHTSHTYGNALQVLRAAFDQDRARLPSLIVKIGWENMSGSFAENYATGGDCYELFAQLKREDLVRRFVLEVFPWSSDTALRAIRGGYPEGMVDGYIFYLNPLQRFASNELWNVLVERKEPVIAMRTVSGGNIHSLRDVPGYAWKEYLQKRAGEVVPVFERSGVPSWTEFCVRFAHSFPQVRATVGATGRLENLKQFLAAAKNIQPLPADIIEEITRLHYRWSDELDRKAETWSM